MKTITKTLGLAAALLTGTVSFAQNISLGLTGGYQRTSYDAFNFEDSYNGAEIGITGIYSSSSSYGFGADLTYARTGGSYEKINTRNEVQTFRAQTDNIRFTPKFHYFFGDLEDRIRPTLMAGPSVGFNVRTKQLSNFDNFQDDFRTVNLGGVLGAGLHYQLINGLWLQGSVNYLVGATQLNKDTRLISNNLRSNDLSLNLGVTYSLNLAKKKL